jgi:hypothetical protein
MYAEFQYQFSRDLDKVLQLEQSCRVKPSSDGKDAM